MQAALTFRERIAQLPLSTQLWVLSMMVDDLLSGKDQTIAALQAHAKAITARIVLVGGVAVIRHGYPRPTNDRDFLVDYRDVAALADRLMDDADWERLEIRQYAFVYKPTSIPVDFLTSGDLMELGRPYLFPHPEKVEKVGTVEGVPIIGLHELLFLKLLAGRMRDLGDAMELCKLHLDEIDAEKVVGILEPEDDDLRQKFHQLLQQAPVELAKERRLGQGVQNLPRKPPVDT